MWAECETIYAISKEARMNRKENEATKEANARLLTVTALHEAEQ